MIDPDELAARVGAWRRVARTGDRRAAVALAVVPAASGVALLVEERAATLTAHPGQYALPGGRIDPGEDAVAAALRETREELGVDEDAWEVVGLLDDYVTHRGTVITPVVMRARRPVAPSPAPAEVQQLFTVPIAASPAPEYAAAAHQPYGVAGAVPALRITLDGLDLFAPTGAIVHQFLRLAVDGEIVRVDDFREPAFADGRRLPLAAAHQESTACSLPS